MLCRLAVNIQRCMIMCMTLVEQMFAARNYRHRRRRVGDARETHRSRERCMHRCSISCGERAENAILTHMTLRQVYDVRNTRGHCANDECVDVLYTLRLMCAGHCDIAINVLRTTNGCR